MTTAPLAEERQFVAYGLLVALWHALSCVANAGPKPTKAVSRRTMAARLRGAMVRLFTAARPFQRGATEMARCVSAGPSICQKVIRPAITSSCRLSRLDTSRLLAIFQCLFEEGDDLLSTFPPALGFERVPASAGGVFGQAVPGLGVELGHEFLPLSCA